ncbi:DUF3108 domain-containing protein [Polynucleobacter sp. AP-Kolm-20A-A1]|uniref:DUF3108 domain-containing protein n=1 Tax=Polynucleobacter sp. AP-Kolm-20A-A1 TaxID=2081041 RepID=UPI001BFDA41F|nr:DUF3108 domain-containing protein [Polynucleobacter sp. AP-Kolm-20A-A1]QWE21525.1 DUF3108 domain-containing protein [Polynucleobacter sp. AP-Kolm-20A-A1]
MKSLRIVLTALALSLFGHLILFFGIPFLSFNSAPQIPEDLIIRTELKVEPPKKIQMSKSLKQTPKQTSKSSQIADDKSQIPGGQGGSFDQQGAAFKLPESGVIYYDSYVDGQKYQTGEIDWINEGGNYRLYIYIPYAFVGPFVFESRGTIDSYGIAPLIYWTQRGTKSPRYSRFDRNEKGEGQMFFSEKPEFTPKILPGTQDRFSLLFQFASLLNGDNKIDESGSIRSIPVVDYNTLEMWQFKSYGESLSDDVPSLGKAVNRHYALMQRENDPYKRQVDIWFSKDLDWLPGRIRSLESNGRVLELVFKQRNPLPSPAKVN